MNVAEEIIAEATAHNQRIISHIDGNLNSLVEFPAVWGEPGAVETAVIVLCDLRWMILGHPKNLRPLLHRFVREELPGSGSLGILGALRKVSRESELPAFLGKYVERVRACRGVDDIWPKEEK